MHRHVSALAGIFLLFGHSAMAQKDPNKNNIKPIKPVDLMKEECKHWAEQGFCDEGERIEWMQTNCPESCEKNLYNHREAIREHPDLDITEIQQGFYELSAKDPSGKVHRMDNFEGTTMVIVTAPRKCDKGTLFQTLEHIHSLHPYEVEILVFPFTNKDEDTSECQLDILKREIRGSKKIHIMHRVDINGPDTDPIFKYLKTLFKLDPILEEYPTYFFIDPDGVPIEVDYGAGYETLKKFIDKYSKME